MKGERSELLGVVTKTVACLGFLGVIVAANYVTTNYGIVPVGFGLMATAGTYFVGASFILRDFIQDKLGRLAVLGLIAFGAGLSYGVSAQFIATASAVAFLLSETADWAVYSPLRKRGYVRAAVASNVVGAVVDTAVFLSIAGFPWRAAFAGQVIGKLAVTVAAVAVVAVFRWKRR